jgi:hypothetical protein
MSSWLSIEPGHNEGVYKEVPGTQVFMDHRALGAKTSEEETGRPEEPVS